VAVYLDQGFSKCHRVQEDVLLTVRHHKPPRASDTWCPTR
jgi:hypothetical protein